MNDGAGAMAVAVAVAVAVDWGRVESMLRCHTALMAGP